MITIPTILFIFWLTGIIALIFGVFRLHKKCDDLELDLGVEHAQHLAMMDGLANECCEWKEKYEKLTITYSPTRKYDDSNPD